MIVLRYVNSVLAAKNFRFRNDWWTFFARTHHSFDCIFPAISVSFSLSLSLPLSLSVSLSLCVFLYLIIIIIIILWPTLPTTRELFDRPEKVSNKTRIKHEWKQPVLQLLRLKWLDFQTFKVWSKKKKKRQLLYDYIILLSLLLFIHCISSNMLLLVSTRRWITVVAYFSNFGYKDWQKLNNSSDAVKLEELISRRDADWKQQLARHLIWFNSSQVEMTAKRKRKEASWKGKGSAGAFVFCFVFSQTDTVNFLPHFFLSCFISFRFVFLGSFCLYVQSLLTFLCWLCVFSLPSNCSCRGALFVLTPYG